MENCWSMTSYFSAPFLIRKKVPIFKTIYYIIRLNDNRSKNNSFTVFFSLQNHIGLCSPKNSLAGTGNANFIRYFTWVPITAIYINIFHLISHHMSFACIRKLVSCIFWKVYLGTHTYYENYHTVFFA